jgi:hypothetical protein
MPPSAVSSPSVKSSDDSCFSPLTNLRTPAHQIPPCVACGKPSVGGHALEIDGPIMDLEFSCGCDGDNSYTVMSRALYPCYAFVGELSPGVYRVRRLERSEMLKRVTK